MSAPRPLIDRRRSSSRGRSGPVSPLSSPGGSPLLSPVGSPPGGSGGARQGILKQRQHPAEQHERGRARAGVEGSVSELSLADSRATGTSDANTLAGRPSTSSRETRASTPASSVAPTTAGGAAAPQYRRRVAFDSFEAGRELEGKPKTTGGGTGVTYSFTLSAKSSEYCRTRWSRTFLVATDLNEYSVNATDWLLSSFLEDNDEVVVLRVIEPGSSAHQAWKASMEEARDEAEGVLEYLMRKNGEVKQISLIVEFAIGPIEETIHRMIEIYKPDSLIVGTRGRPDSLFKSAFMGSISRWAVARSPVPVVVVRPDDKVREGLERRMQDSKRGRSYVSLLTEEERRALLPRISTQPASGPNGAKAGLQPSAASAADGAPLERTLTAPEAGHAPSGKSGGSGNAAAESPVDSPVSGAQSPRQSGAGGKSGGGVGSGLRVAFGFGTKSGDGKKKDKSKALKKFGTFS
ncbi:hypothetical protein Rhopal_005956-T1 [Rhodotorula paludigena]|uniref:UspA domain-containing protein n=1 Tax=Rhodotorula paludigena TaxID=86838 RepID=A0AAV5GUL4_9BASI|nr:hypothetical protein Rhopal_005956-T1 [Rhodotorula paludigena]